MSTVISYEWRGAFDDAEVDSLHAEGFGHAPSRDGWWGRVTRHGRGWVCARANGALVGFVNVAWGGASHAFILDTVVAQTMRRRGIGVRLIVVAVDEARAAGVGWLHVDCERDLRDFYLEACGFTPTPAGLIALSQPGPA